MSTLRVVVVSDSHLSPRVTATERNWSAVLEHIDATRPDLVLHLGDVSMDGAHDESDLSYARDQMDRVSARWIAIPGNHDIGDTPSATIEPDDVVTLERVQRWVDHFGPDRWAIELGTWKVIGVDAQLFGSGLPAEDDQWDFVQTELVGAQPDPNQPDRNQPDPKHIVLTHKPVAAASEELARAPRYRFIPPPAQQRLWDQVRQTGVEAVISGHVHQSRCLAVDGMAQLWAPTTWAVLPESAQRTIGTKRCGVLELKLSEAGTISHAFVEPPGMVQLTMLLGGGYPPSD